MSKMLWIILLVGISHCAAAEIACTSIPYTQENQKTSLHPAKDPKSQIYFFENKSQKSIWLDRYSKNPGASAGWATYIRPGNWSALVVNNKKDLVITCTTIQPGTVISIDCAKVLRFCAPKNGSATPLLKGTYWLAEDKPPENFVKTLEKKGIKF